MSFKKNGNAKDVCVWMMFGIDWGRGRKNIDYWGGCIQ
jgi:hypothetical protein